MSAADDRMAGRFEHRGELGAGEVGIVHRVLDRARDEEVALKVLRRLGGRELYRFKREFRMLADLEHPNLVRLHDLFEVGGDWMYTMELVDGVPFGQWVRAPGLDEARLREALYQLADGLIALHAAGRLHRDVKPSNVLVEPSGRVVLLDFGLTTAIGSQEADRTHEQFAVGTPAYMSPEQAADEPLTPASDWYAVGVMLYEALVGRRPFAGSAAAVIVQKDTATPRSPRALVPSVPADLDQLCTRLLARDPARRAGGDDVLATLGRAPSPATQRIQRGQIRAPLVGRDRELAALKEALAASRDHMVLAVVTGPAGSGKTALLRSFGDAAARAGAVVIPSRALEREVIPLRALDPMVDGLSAHLVRLPREEVARLLPEDAPLLAQLFPVMRRVPGLDVPSFLGPAADVHDDETLYRASRAIAELMVAIARSRPIVVLVDDMQWGDEREAALIHRYEGPAAPHVLLVVALRTGPGESDRNLAHYLAFRGDRRRIELSPPAPAPAAGPAEGPAAGQA